MGDFLSSATFTLFDGIVLALMLVSGLMALARGFIRELASILAFVIALAAAIFSYFYITPILQENIPFEADPLIFQIIIVAISFLIVYILAAWFGQKFSRFVHTSTDISWIDRLAGLLFGIARAIAIIILVLFVARPFIEEAQISWVMDSFSYPYFIQGVIWVQSIIPTVAGSVQDALPDNLPDSP
ncbi:CvpA family protein [Ponticaulis sp.]|uniref:CvpA family protein n=1 Tax=Ponticaulis sp. TaxID=2020902 RepID=UPI000B65F9AB|nr:CvpA family protein [Ponticaulis sp.]MAI91942.1 hypothetical protein [Ponticaulis sp.]OUX96415.1 MAG: hypothetical protein CBB65_16045 [Hyphomonadaceae bacterium TMED5]|tara:strand:- start:19158 stop:19715 length:558 start_codon:yes stop_codon:yes gene_type:complete